MKTIGILIRYNLEAKVTTNEQLRDEFFLFCFCFAFVLEIILFFLLRLR